MKKFNAHFLKYKGMPVYVRGQSVKKWSRSCSKEWCSISGLFCLNRSLESSSDSKLILWQDFYISAEVSGYARWVNHSTSSASSGKLSSLFLSLPFSFALSRSAWWALPNFLLRAATRVVYSPQWSGESTVRADPCKLKQLFQHHISDSRLLKHLELELVCIPRGATIKGWWFLLVRCSPFSWSGWLWCKRVVRGSKFRSVGHGQPWPLIPQFQGGFLLQIVSSSPISSCMIAVLEACTSEASFSWVVCKPSSPSSIELIRHWRTSFIEETSCWRACIVVSASDCLCSILRYLLFCASMNCNYLASWHLAKSSCLSAGSSWVLATFSKSALWEFLQVCLVFLRQGFLLLHSSHHN